MNIYDKVIVKKDNKRYNEQGIYKGMVGRICSSEIRDNTFQVCFIDPSFYDEKFEFNDQSIKSLKDDIFCMINIDDLELVEKGWANDKDILEDLPKNNPKWWCKVENGYIMNLLGEKKNKIPYDYNS